MTKRKAGIASALATASFLSLGIATASMAQEMPAQPAPVAEAGDDQAEETGAEAQGDTIIVTGTRRNDLTAANSPTPTPSAT